MPAASLGSSRIEATVRLAGMPAASRVAQPSGAKGGGADGGGADGGGNDGLIVGVHGQRRSYEELAAAHWNGSVRSGEA